MRRASQETTTSDAAIPAGAGRPGKPDLPPADACGHFGLRIARDGTWYYHGSPIGRKAIAKLFATVLRREDDGSYWLVTPAERGRIDVDDAPFVATELEVRQETGRQQLIFTTNLDRVVTADAEHRLRVEPWPDRGAGGEGGTPYLHLGAGLDARLSRPVYYQLAEIAEVRKTERGPAYGVWSEGVFFPLGPASPADAGAD